MTLSDTANVRFQNNKKYYIYKVGKSETLYGIAKKFNVNQQDILELNPEVKNGLKADIDLLIPVAGMNHFTNTNGNELKFTPVNTKGDDHLQIAFITSLELSKVYTGTADTSDTSAVFEPIAKQTVNNLQFVEGAIAAAENFNVSNKNFKLSTIIIDAENDTLQLAKIAWKFKSVDVWITNETGPVLTYLNNLSIKNGVQIISCGINTADILKTNSNAVALLPGSLLQCELMAATIARKFPEATALFLKTSNSREIDRMKSFKRGWTAINENPNRTIDLAKSTVNAIVDSLHKSKKQIIFVPSSNEDLITNLLIALKAVKDDFDFILVGLPTWYNFETIDPMLLQQCNAWFFNSGAVPPLSNITLEFRQTFRNKYATEPLESAYIGFDATNFLLNGRKQHGKDFLKIKSSNSYNGFFSDYHFESADEDGCLENKHISVWNFQNIIPEKLKEN